MGKVVGSKEKGTNSYAKDNQKAIKALSVAGKVAGTLGSAVGTVVATGIKKVKQHLDKKKKQKDMEAVDV